MKKFLLSLALFAGSVFGTVAQTDMETELTITPVWVNDVADGVANKIPDVDTGWDHPTATNPGGKTCCRFAVGKDGKLLFNNHKENAIMAWDGNAWSTYAKLPAVTATEWSGNDASPADAKWNGSAITTDDAGNVIYNYCFINVDKSLQYWGVVAADGTITDVDLSTPLADLGTHGRLDIIGHIVGDVNSEKGGIGYATTAASSNNVIMFHFKGDGQKVTSLTAKSFEVAGLASNGAYVPSPKYLTVDELMANGAPEQEFYVPYGTLNSAEVLDGYLASGDETLKGFGNRQYNTSAVFSLHGNKYIVRSYVAPNNPNGNLLTGWRAVMTFGIFDLATGECMASWQDSEYSNTYGYGTISAEPVDDDTVNVYMFVCTGSKDDNNPAVAYPAGYGGMFTVTATEVPAKPKGTAEFPYVISTPEDLVNMNGNLKANGYTYFELANDIDMAGVEYPMPAQSAVANVHLDGKNHIIKNLTINGPFAGLFSLMNGSVKNLGFVDIDLTCANWGGAGAIAGYIANDEPTTIENCFVTGKLSGSNAQLGSFACGAKIGGATITNCYSTATLTSAGGGMQGGLIGAVMYAEGKENILTINNSYFGGSISSNGTVGGFVGANQSYLHPATGNEVINLTNCALLDATLTGAVAVATANTTETGTLNADNVVVAKSVVNGAAVDDAAIYNAIPEVMAWDGFNATEVSETTNLPILAWQSGMEYKSNGTLYAPYFIATAEDLCNAHNLIVAGAVTYFLQTADIDMAGIADYITINGTYGDYTSAIVYDGQNHLIKNFAPTYEADGGARGYYCTSIFGVMTGVVKNLGVVDANVDTSSNPSQGAGILAAYVGHGSASNLFASSTFENVFVTGTLKAGSKYTGVFGGTTATDVEFTNCYVNVNVEVTGGPAGAIIGRTNNNVVFNNCYAAGTVSEACSLVSGSGNGSVTADGLVVFNTGSTSVCATTADVNATMANTAETKEAGVAEVSAWEAFSAEKEVYGLPGLASFDYTYTTTVGPDGTAEHPFEIATVEDLCNAYLKVKANPTGATFFVQTADIDMAEVKDWHAICGFNGDATYGAVVGYDGQNHLIKNFSPEVTAPDAAADNYYMGTIFGVLSGYVKNLGIVDANVVNNQQGGGFLAAYAGHSASAQLMADTFEDYSTYIENVFVTGSYDASGNGNYIGGFVGTTGANLTIENSFVNAEIKAENNVGGLVGRLRNELEITHTYVAGTVSGTGANVALAISSDKTPAVIVDGVYAFNTGAEAAVVGAVADDEIIIAAATDAEAIAAVAEWEAFSAEKEVYGLPGLASFDYTVALPGPGTAENPYVIATVEDLCNAYLKVQENMSGMTYFVQTADIDMAEVKDWHPLNGFNGVYTAAIHYDGQNHLIKNFSPEVVAPDAASNNYYMGTIFGVLSGTVKNLGIVDADVTNAQQGGGFLAAYAGHSASESLLPDGRNYVQNVFVTGKYDATGNSSYIGGLFGTTGGMVTVENCFVNAEIKAENNVGGLVGRLRNELEITHTYVAGTVSGTGANVALAISSDRTPAVIVDGVYAFNTGAEAAVVGAVADDEVVIAAATDAEAIAAVAEWDAFSAEKEVYGLPGLASFDYTVALPEPIVAASVAETIALESGTEFDVNYELTVAFVNYKNVFACDAAGDFIQLYGENTLKVGDVIPAGWHGTYELYKGNTPEIKDFVLPENITEGTFEPAEVAAEDVTVDLVNSVVIVKGVVLDEATPAGKANFTGKVGDVELTFYNNYKLESVEAGTYDITFVVTIYNGAPSLYVINYTKDETTGIEGITAEDADAVYYNLQGVEVANPESGIYIVRRGNQVTKEVIRK